NLAYMSIRVLRPEVAYIRMRILTGIGVAGTRFERAELRALHPSGNPDVGIVRAQQNANVPLFQSGATPPAQSLLPIGTMIATDTGILTVTQRKDYRLAVLRAGGSGTISVTETVSGVAAGDMVAIEKTGGGTYFTTVASV